MPSRLLHDWSSRIGVGPGPPNCSGSFHGRLRDRRLDLERTNLRRPARSADPGATPAERNEVIRFIDEAGPGIGLPVLRESFPLLARAELEDVLRRYRRVWRKLNRQPIHVLHWTQPGTVWAIDFHGPRLPIDNQYAYLLAVRDLASGAALLWQPVADAAAQSVVEALAALFADHGAPLVVKSDNGSAFVAESVRELLEKYRVKIVVLAAPYATLQWLH